MALGMMLTLSELQSVVTIRRNHSVNGSSTCHSVHVGAQFQLLGLESICAGEAGVRLWWVRRSDVL